MDEYTQRLDWWIGIDSFFVIVTLTINESSTKSVAICKSGVKIRKRINASFLGYNRHMSLSQLLSNFTRFVKTPANHSSCNCFKINHFFFGLSNTRHLPTFLTISSSCEGPSHKQIGLTKLVKWAGSVSFNTATSLEKLCGTYLGWTKIFSTRLSCRPGVLQTLK